MAQQTIWDIIHLSPRIFWTFISCFGAILAAIGALLSNYYSNKEMEQQFASVKQDTSIISEMSNNIKTIEPLAKRGMIYFHQKDKITDCNY
jgi:hypothetical protein